MNPLHSMRTVSLLLAATLVLTASTQPAWGQFSRPEGRKGLPQEHEYQKQLRAYLATLKVEDFNLPAGELRDVVATDLDGKWRRWALAVDVPRVGAKRSAPSLNLPAEQFVLSHLESPTDQTVIAPSVWPETLVWIANWKDSGNSYAGSRAAKLRAFVAAAVDLMMMDEQQEFSKAPLFHRADWFGPHLVMYAYVYAGTRDVLPPEACKAFESGLAKMVRRVNEWGPKGEECFLDMTVVTGMAILSKTLKDPETLKIMEAYARRFLTDGEFYHKAGYFADQGCFDPGFNGLTMYFATWAAVASDWPWARESVAQTWKLRGYLMLPEPDAHLRPSKQRTLLGPTHMTFRTGSHSSNDQWPWAFKPIAGAYLSDDAMCQVNWPTEGQLDQAAPASAARGMRAENPNDGGRFLKNEELKSRAWTWRLWPGSGVFPMNNFAYDHYPAGFGAHRAELLKKKPEMFQLPFDRTAGFIETFGDEFLIAKTSGADTCGVIVHSGPVSQFPGKNLLEYPNAPYGLGGGTLSAYWTPTTGSVILGRRGGMFPPNGVPTNYDKPEEWRNWPVHAVIGTTGGNTFFTSARNQKPRTTHEVKDGKATVKVAGTIPATPLGKDKGLAGKIDYNRTFAFAPEGLSIQTSVEGDGQDKVAELYEVIPVLHREAGLQSDKDLKTTIELQVGNDWSEATPAFTSGVTAIRLTRFTGAVLIRFDRPRRVRLSPAETTNGFLTAHVCRNVLIDLLENNDQPAAVKDAKSVRYTIAPVKK